MAIKRASPVGSSQNESNFLENVDCSLMTYRLVNQTAMHTGCFSETAYGLMDIDNDVVLYNGTDEALPLLPYGSRESLVPWPGSENLVVLSATATGGSYVSMYKNALVHLADQRDYLGRLVAKQITAPPDLQLTDPAGSPLVINTDTMAFSAGGGWVVFETLGGSFVRLNLDSLAVMPFAPSYFHPGSPALLRSRVAVSPDGRYVAIANTSDQSIKVFDLTTCGGDLHGLQPFKCPVYNYLPFIKDQISGFQSISHLRFVNEGLLSFVARTNSSDQDGVYELAPTANLNTLTDYVGLGDSYTSGEGAFDYISDTDSANNMCHLSGWSYPLLLTHDLYSSAGGHSVACSGAVINDIGSASDTYRGQVKGVANFKQLQQDQPALLNSIMTNFVPGYVAQQRFVREYRPKVVTVSVGGDDVGFGDMVEACVTPHLSRHLSDSTCFNTYEDRKEILNLIDRTIPKWTRLYGQLLASSPETRLYAIGYPQIIDDKGSCGLNVHLDQSELEFAVELVNYLNQAIKQAADQAGVNYVDISQALNGHRLCEATNYNIAINGLTAGRDAGFLGLRVFGHESYHPNALGQALIEQTILQKTHNLQIVPPPSPIPDTSKLLTVPKTGRPISNRLPTGSMTDSIAKRDQPIPIKLNGADNGLKPNTTYTVRLDGPNGQPAGSINTDNNGDLNGSVNIPGSVEPGGHTIDVNGSDQADEPIYVVQPIYVPGDDNDADGDGLPDDKDSCPGAFNSGIDADGDNIDDVCDPLIQAASPIASPGPPTALTSMPAAKQGTSSSLKTVNLSTYDTSKSSSVLQANRRQPTANHKPAELMHKTKFASHKTALRRINWLPWAVLPIVLWWLAFLLAAWSKWKGFG